MDTLVQKFGGTSLGKADRMLNVAKIITQFSKTHRNIIIVSAMSSYIKTEGTTSRLIEASQEALKKGAYYKIVDTLEENHIQCVDEVVENVSLRESCKEKISNELKYLKSFLEAIQVIGEISPRSEDVIISTGEKLCAIILSSLLNSMGIDSEYVNLEGLIKKKFSDLNSKFYEYLIEQLVAKIENCDGRIPIVTGFFGPVPFGIIQSIGRGYTDFTSALIAAGLKAKELQIWKKVDGIYSSDPRKVKSAKVLKSITPEEAAELTYYGSEVIHPFTMEQVIKSKIPIRIKNTFHPELDGTLIDPNTDANKLEKKPVAVTCKKNITILNVNSNRMLMATGFMSKVFLILQKHNTVIDLISTSEVNISMSLESTNELSEILKDMSAFSQVSVEKDLAILSLVGQGMKHKHGIAGKMFTELAKANINIEMISQGASEINISCVIRDQEANRALNVIHKALLE